MYTKELNTEQHEVGFSLRDITMETLYICSYIIIIQIAIISTLWTWYCKDDNDDEDDKKKKRKSSNIAINICHFFQNVGHSCSYIGSSTLNPLPINLIPLPTPPLNQIIMHDWNEILSKILSTLVVNSFATFTCLLLLCLYLKILLTTPTK